MKCVDVSYRSPAIICFYSIAVSTIKTFLLTCYGQVQIADMWNRSFLFTFVLITYTALWMLGVGSRESCYLCLENELTTDYVFRSSCA